MTEFSAVRILNKHNGDTIASLRYGDDHLMDQAHASFILGHLKQAVMPALDPTFSALELTEKPLQPISLQTVGVTVDNNVVPVVPLTPLNS